MNFQDCETTDVLTRLLPNNDISGLPEKWVHSLDDLSASDLLDDDVLYDTELDAVEGFASENGLIATEGELSESFDNMILEVVSPETLCIFENGNDLPLIREEFNNWADSLCKDNALHPLQYNEYCYCGKFQP